MLSQPVGQPDRAADVLGVLVSDQLVGVQRVAVAVQARDRHPGALEDAQIFVAGRVADQDVVERRDVHGGQESAGVDLDTGEPEIRDHLQGVGQWTVVKNCVVDAEFHSETCFPLSRAEAVTAARSSMLWTPSSKVAQRGSEDASSMPATSSRNARAW